MSESMHFQLLLLGQPDLDQEITDVDSLVSLQLQHLTILRMLHHRTVAGKLLRGREVWRLVSERNELGWASVRVVHPGLTFLHTLTSFFLS